MRRISDIWPHGAAQGVWKKMQTRVVGEREEIAVWNWGAEEISSISDMVTVTGADQGTVSEVTCEQSVRIIDSQSARSQTSVGPWSTILARFKIFQRFNSIF